MTFDKKSPGGDRGFDGLAESAEFKLWVERVSAFVKNLSPQVPVPAGQGSTVPERWRF